MSSSTVGERRRRGFGCRFRDLCASGNKSLGGHAADGEYSGCSTGSAARARAEGESWYRGLLNSAFIPRLVNKKKVGQS